MYIQLILLPFITFLIISLFGRFIGIKGTIILIIISMIKSLIISLMAIYEVILENNILQLEFIKLNLFNNSFINNSPFNINLIFIFDQISVIMLFIIISISLIVIIYTYDYMIEDPHIIRFYLLIILFLFTMILLITSTYLPIIFIGWEGVGISSYLLISFWFTRFDTSLGALLALFMNRIGDVFFILGIILAYFLFGSVDLNIISSVINTYNYSILINLFFISLFIAAMAKSAQILLHLWLPYSMEGFKFIKNKFILWYNAFSMPHKLIYKINNSLKYTLQTAGYVILFFFIVFGSLSIINLNNFYFNFDYTGINGLILWNSNKIFGKLNLRLTFLERSLIKLNNFVISVIIGLMLSDGWMMLKNLRSNPRLSFTQSLVNFPFFWNVYNSLSLIIRGFPIFRIRFFRNKHLYSLNLTTRSLPYLWVIYNLFYKLSDSGDKYIRYISSDLIFYMNPIVLAYWIMGDGFRHNKGLMLSTDGFSIKEVVMLINILIICFNINPIIYTYKGLYHRIYINEKDLNILKPLINPYMVDEMLYKLKGEKKNS